MSNLSEKQIIFRDYLIRKIGFIEDNFLNSYIKFLEMVSPRLKSLGKQKKVWDNQTNSFQPEKRAPYKKYIEKNDYFLPDVFNVIDLLNTEISIKKNNDFTQKEIQLKYISATDISNFTYCPVSFAISKTFELPKLESAILGASQHEKQTLINYLEPEDEEDYIIIRDDEKINRKFSHHRFHNKDNEAFFKELLQSSIIFHGHSEVKGKSFKSSKGNFIGQPDYIFRNDRTNDIFVVEEKFQLVPHEPYFNQHLSQSEEEEITRKRTSRKFFNNHINQLNSYIYGIDEYDIKYGFLIYWKYVLYSDGEPYIVNCVVLRVEKSAESRHQIKETFISIKNLIINKGATFDINSRVPAKCASCVSNFLCGHKTGKFAHFSIPYSKDYIKLYPVPFPEELKKQVTPTDKKGKS